MAWYDNIPGLSQMALPVTIERGKPAPLDKYSLFDTYDEAIEFITNHDAAYVGAFIFIMTGNSEEHSLGAYVVTGIKEQASLNKLAETTASGDLAADVAALKTQMNTLLASADTAGSIDNKIKVANETLKSEVDTSLGELKTTVDASVAALEASIKANAAAIAGHKTAVDASLAVINASIAEIETAVENVAVYNLESVQSPDAQWAAQYNFTKDGSVVTTINIPKDQFLKEATFVDSATAEDKAIDDSVVVGQPYLKFTWEIELESGVSITYVPVNKLVDTYVGSDYITVSAGTDNKIIALDYNKLVTDLKSDVVTDIDASIGEITDKIDVIDSSITSIKNDIADLVTKDASIDSSLGKLVADIADLVAKDTAIDSSLGKIVTKLGNVDTSLGELVAADKAMQADITKLKAAKVNGQAFTDNAGTLEATVKGINIQVGKAVKSLGVTEATTIDAAIEAIAGKIDTVDTGVASVVSNDTVITVDNSDAKNPKVGLAISAEADNIIEAKADGIYASIQWETIA